MAIPKLIQKENKLRNLAQDEMLSLVVELLSQVDFTDKEKAKKAFKIMIRKRMPKYYRTGMQLGLDFLNNKEL